MREIQDVPTTLTFRHWGFADEGRAKYLKKKPMTHYALPGTSTPFKLESVHFSTHIPIHNRPNLRKSRAREESPNEGAPFHSFLRPQLEVPGIVDIIHIKTLRPARELKTRKLRKIVGD